MALPLPDPLDAGNPQYGNGNVQVLKKTATSGACSKQVRTCKDLVELDQWRFSPGLFCQDWAKVSEENRDSDNCQRSALQVHHSGRGALPVRRTALPHVSYSESFNPNTVSDQEGRPLAPTEGTQWEAGISISL
jgi:iron complex outermembrane receptor protein